MSEIKWPTTEQVHEMFGNHPTAAKTVDIQDLLELAHDNAADIPEGVYRAMAKQYDEATNGSLCPCGSKKTYSGCCKEDWIRTVRWRKQAQQDAKAAKKEDHKDTKEATGGDVEWLLRIGYDKKTGGVKFTAVPGQNLERINPYALRDAVRATLEQITNNIMAAEVAEMVFPKVLEALAQRQAQAQGQQGVNLLNPMGEPVKAG